MEEKETEDGLYPATYSAPRDVRGVGVAFRDSGTLSTWETEERNPDNSTYCWCERTEGRACTGVTQDREGQNWQGSCTLPGHQGQTAGKGCQRAQASHFS